MKDEENFEEAFHKQMGQRMQDVRTRLGFSQDVLAEMAGMRQATISLVERGESSCSLYTLARIADCLNVGLDELCFEKVTSASTYRLPELRDRLGVRGKERVRR